MNEILKIKGLTKRYENADETIIENLNMTLERHSFLCILGPSGCGKTTFLRCVAGFEPFDGEILINDKPVVGPASERFMVFQDFNQLFPWKTVANNIAYPLKKQGIGDKKERKKIVDECLKKVNLDGYQNYYPHQLSGGMKQRVAIAKALALKPEIILMDEPFAALDAMTRTRLQSELLEITQKEHITVIFITHNIQEAVMLGTRIMLMTKGGKIKIDRQNPMERPVNPATPGYAELWDELHTALNEEDPKK